MNSKCDVCGGEIIFVKTPEFVHYGKNVCSKCGKFFEWVRNPKRVNSGRFETSKYKPWLDRCSFCGRTRDELGIKETITLHHSLPLSEGGEDKKDNIIHLCTACHKLAHWQRLYNYKHLKGVVKNDS